MASGLENITKFASDMPKILPVNSNTSFAISSPLTAASKTSFDVISSILIDLKTLGRSDKLKISLADSTTPVAEA